MKRFPTDYPGVFYREAARIGGKGFEKIYYVVYKKNGKTLEEKAGRHYAEDMTPARAGGIRAELIEGKRLSRKEQREKRAEEKKIKSDRWTIGRLFEDYDKNNAGRKDRTNDINRFKNHIAPALKQSEPANLIPLDVDRLRIKLQKSLKPGTVRNVLELLRRIINHGVNKNLCGGPGFKIKLPTVNNIKTEDLTADELARFFDAIEKDEHPYAGPLMKMALFTGMRRGELFKLKWSDIKEERGFILLRDPKGGPDQQIPLNDSVRDLLKKIPKFKRSPFVFPGRGGEKRVDINKAVNRIKKAAILPTDFRPLHGLRHSYASMLASSGKVDLYTLQKLLTHKSAAMTQRYAHLRDETLKAASNLTGSLIDEALESSKEKAKSK